MPIDKEERLVILYSLYSCGGKGSKGRIIYFIMKEGLLKPRDGDDDVRQGNETKIENDLAWARQDLKEKGLLSMPEHGTWKITEDGRKLVEKRAAVFFEKPPEADWFARFSPNFIACMKKLGQNLLEKKNER